MAFSEKSLVKASIFPKPDKKEKPVDYLSLQFAHPAWLVKKWSQNFLI